jgi:hypothetical protein
MVFAEGHEERERRVKVAGALLQVMVERLARECPPVDRRGGAQGSVRPETIPRGGANYY